MGHKLTLVFAMIGLAFAQSASAQIFGGGGDEKPSSEFIPRSAVLGAAAFPKKIAANPDFKAFPHEVVTAWGKKELGFDPMLITEVTFMLKRIEDFPPEGEPGWAAVLHFEKMQGLAGAMINQLEEKTVGGKTVYSGDGNTPSFMVFDESTLIIGNEMWFEELITATGQGKLVELFNGPDVKGQMMTFADIKQMRPMLNQMMLEFDKYEIPPQVNNLRNIPDLVDSLEAGLNVDGKVESTLILHAASNDAAKRVNEIVIEAMKYGKTALLAQMATELDLEDPVQAATLQYTRRVAEKYEAKLTPKINGSDLSVTMNEEVVALPFFMGMIGSMSRSMEFERKMNPALELRQTAIGLLNYESAYQKFPPTTINDENGKPLFSGIVRMLPFVEQNAIYEQLKLDEPWDSEHNSQFTSMAIKSFGVAGDGRATVRYPIFPGSLWDEGGEKRFRDIQDGSSNTILAVQAPEGSAASWADPTPWKISATNPMRDIFGDRDEVVVVMVDASTHVLKRSEMNNEKLKAMLTVAGEEVIEW